MKVWAISSGSYSDYQVDAIFTTKEAATETALKIGLEADDIEEFELYDQPAEVKTKYHMRLWLVEPPPEDRIEGVYSFHEQHWEEAVPDWDLPKKTTGVDVFRQDDNLFFHSAWNLPGHNQRQAVLVTVSGFDKAAVEKSFYEVSGTIKARYLPMVKSYVNPR